MREIKLFSVLIGVIVYMSVGYSEPQRALEIIPERAEITYGNDKYIANYFVKVRRYSRRGSYLVSLWGVTKHTWTNNITVDVILYEYLHNEYKRSFVEMHYKLCDLVNKDQFIGGLLRKYGVVCPILKGFTGVINVTMTLPAFAYKFPFEKCKAEVIVTTESHELIGTGNLFIVVKQVPLNKMKTKN